MAPAVVVLVLVVVELGAGHDLAGHRGRGSVAEHGDLDLAADDGLLEDEPSSCRAERDRGAAARRGRAALATPDRGAHVGGLHEDREPSPLETVTAASAGCSTVGPVERQPAGLGDAAAASTSLAMALSMASAEPSTPEPT